MTILDTFYILFESKTDGVRDGAKDASRHVDEFERHVDKTNKTTKDLGISFTEIGKTVAELAVSYLAISSAFDLAKNTIVMNAELDKMSKRTGVAVHDFQTLQYAVNAFGGDGNAVLGQLNSYFQEMVSTGRAASFKDAFEGLDRLQQQMAAIQGEAGGHQRALTLAAKFGVTGDLADLLNQLRDAYLAGMANASSLAGADAKLAEESRKLISDLEKFHQALEKITNKIEGPILEILNNFLDKVNVVIGGGRLGKGNSKVAEFIDNPAPVIGSYLKNGFIDDHPDLKFLKGFFGMIKDDFSNISVRHTDPSYFAPAAKAGAVTINVPSITINAGSGDPQAISQHLLDVFNTTIMNAADGFFLP